MNDSLIRTFCETRYRWLIVAGATLLVALAALWPQVDDYFDNRTNCNALKDDVAQSQQKAAAIPDLRSRHGDLDSQLRELEARAIGSDQVGAYRNRIVELAGQSLCKVRRIEMGRPNVRPWKVQDQAVAAVHGAAGKNTPFALVRHGMVITVDGTMSNLHQLLDLLSNEKRLVHPRRVELRSASGAGTLVTLELELWLFTLELQSA